MFRRRKKLLPLIACGMAYVLWGLNAPAIKLSLDVLPIAPLLLVKFGIGALFFSLISIHRWRKLSSATNTRVLLATLSGYVVSTILFYEGVRLSGGLSASLIYLLAPLLLYFMSIKLLRERFNGRLLAGLIFGLLGGTLIVCSPMFGHAQLTSDFVGNMLVIAAIVLDVIGTILIKPVLGKIPTLQVTAIRFIIAVIVFIPLALLQIDQIHLESIDGAVLSAISYNIIFATLIAFYLYHWGLSKIKAEEASPLHYLDPAVGAVASIALLNEQPTNAVLLGVLLVGAGLYYGEAGLRLPFHIGHHR